MLWMPMISTYGSGAAVEFLADEYDSLLAEQCDTTGMTNCLRLVKNYDKSIEDYLKSKSQKYSIEKSVSEYIRCLERI